MKFKKYRTLLLLAALCAVMFSGCRKTQESTSSVSSPVSGVLSSSADSASGSEQSAPSLPPAASQPPESGSVGQVIPVQTDDKAFDELFAKNPVDKAYVKENNQAYSNVDMIDVSDKYAMVWQKQIDDAYKQLMGATTGAAKAKLQKEQEDWKSGSDTALSKIDTDAHLIGGSMAEVDAASRRMEYYRNRAACVYKELYQYKKDFSYNFK